MTRRNFGHTGERALLHGMQQTDGRRYTIRRSWRMALALFCVAAVVTFAYAWWRWA